MTMEYKYHITKYLNYERKIKMGNYWMRKSNGTEEYSIRQNVPKFYRDADDLINNYKIDAIYIITLPDSNCYCAFKSGSSNENFLFKKNNDTNISRMSADKKRIKKKQIPLFVTYYRLPLPRMKKSDLWAEQNWI